MRDLDALANELAHTIPWEPVDESMARWVMLPWHKRLFWWLVSW